MQYITNFKFSVLDLTCYNIIKQAKDAEAPVDLLDQRRLVEDMKEDGMKFRWSAWDIQDDPRVRKYQMLKGPDEETRNEV